MNVSTKTYTISHSEQTTIIVGKNALKELPSLLTPYSHSGYFIVVNSTTKELFLDTAVSALQPLNVPVTTFTLPEGEKGKTMQELTHIFTNMLTNNIDRNGAVIALGGGVVGDVTTVAAGLYTRGIDCIHIPTTLLAQVDSAIGGKGAINTQNHKNMIGVIRQPRLIVVDPQLLQSLPEKEQRSGMGEVIKYALAFDKELFSILSESEMATADFEAIIKRCIEIKMTAVEKDPLDKEGPRALLNFGHTLGHAIELNARIPHGQAIAIGMVFAIKLSQKLNHLSAEVAEDAIDLIKKYGLPTSIKDVNKTEVIAMFSKDKKAVKGNVQFILLKNIGETIIQGDVPKTIIEQVLSEVLQ